MQAVGMLWAKALSGTTRRLDEAVLDFVFGKETVVVCVCCAKLIRDKGSLMNLGRLGRRQQNVPRYHFRYGK
jgi:hypothetical protein